MEVLFRRNGWGGRGPRPRPELWWRCQRCGWLGCQNLPGERLSPMRRLDGDEAVCFFCGEDESNVASDPWEEDGELRDWVVCLTCGTSNTRRLGPAPRDGAGPD
ncbi:hypothetical protein [Thermomonospora cellulosilytica]|uniref:Uncharacterized protein n=1 Tax=Thermomonospora cellulosilytica TaxID=1411118 RepID=A0A7W3MV66_9ACTN|nr:hypothetical protein [Thermomonospora cellulosilytica]MBA9002480.1 hypothetical protein [Thermomonospora cellulosilytica]